MGSLNTGQRCFRKDGRQFICVHLLFFQDRRPASVATRRLLMHVTLSSSLAERVTFPLRRSQDDVNCRRPRLLQFLFIWHCFTAVLFFYLNSPPHPDCFSLYCAVFLMLDVVANITLIFFYLDFFAGLLLILCVTLEN